MKESDAKTKWCPMTGSGNNQGLCIGSACMMWNAAQEIEDKVVEETADINDCKPEGDGWYVISRSPKFDGPDNVKWRRYVDTDSGDCGLKPIYQN